VGGRAVHTHEHARSSPRLYIADLLQMFDGAHDGIGIDAQKAGQPRVFGSAWSRVRCPRSPCSSCSVSCRRMGIGRCDIYVQRHRRVCIIIVVQ
jgi:hypothetical protein